MTKQTQASCNNAQICPSKKQLQALKKQEKRRAQKRQNAMDMLQGVKHNASYSVLVILFLLVIPAFLIYCLWSGENPFYIAIFACASSVFFAVMAAILFRTIANNSQAIVDIIDELDDATGEELCD